jgi:Flp pilus assembly protein TadG
MLNGTSLQKLRERLDNFRVAKEGNIAIIFALTLIPIMILIGMAIDYTRESKVKVQLDTLADSAALAALTPTVIAQGTTAMSSAATTVFNSQVGNLQGLNGVTLSVTPSISGGNYAMTVAYQTTTNLIFSKFIGVNQATISGTSAAAASIAPNIDFYLLLDNSPSMAIAATTAGINTMVSNTPDQCAFACHESDTSPNDYYGLARSLGVTLRMDLLAQATQNLMGTAQTTATANNATYRAAIYTFNIGFNTITALTSSLSTAQSQAANIQLYEVPYQNWNNDTITDYTDAMTQINSIMPNPGNGTTQPGDTPQEVMFFVTDGVEDETVGGSRVQSLMNPSYCTTIKNRGIRIAVLYTAYLPLPTNSWWTQYIKPFAYPSGIDLIGPNMQNCASDGLYFAVTTDGDISAAMKQLFNAAVATAHLTH